MTFQLCRKNNFIRKIRLVPKFLMQQSGQQTIIRHILPNILQTKGSQIMKFVHLVDYNSGVKRETFHRFTSNFPNEIPYVKSYI